MRKMSLPEEGKPLITMEELDHRLEYRLEGSRAGLSQAILDDLSEENGASDVCLVVRTASERSEASTGTGLTQYELDTLTSSDSEPEARPAEAEEEHDVEAMLYQSKRLRAFAGPAAAELFASKAEPSRNGEELDRPEAPRGLSQAALDDLCEDGSDAEECSEEASMLRLRRITAFDSREAAQRLSAEIKEKQHGMIARTGFAQRFARAQLELDRLCIDEDDEAALKEAEELTVTSPVISYDVATPQRRIRLSMLGASMSEAQKYEDFAVQVGSPGRGGA